MSTYFAGNPLPPLVYHVPDIFDVRAQRYRRPELRSSSRNRRWSAQRSPLRIPTPEYSGCHRSYASSFMVIYRRDKQAHEFISANNPDDDDSEFEARFQAVEMGPGLLAQVHNIRRESVHVSIWRISPTLTTRALNINVRFFFSCALRDLSCFLYLLDRIP